MTGKYDLIRQEMTDAGNYNYGYAGAKNGWEYETLQHIADFVQWGFGFGKQGCFACVPKDNPVDAQNILEGYNDYHDWSSPNDSGYGKGGEVSGWETDNGGWVGL